MVFSSITFLFVFLTVVLILTAICPMRCQNLLLLLASLVFYCFGEWRFAGLFLLSTLIDYAVGIWIGASMDKGKKAQAKLALTVSLLWNLGALTVFKYSGLFVRTLNSFGTSFRVPSFVLPLGISFYTFQKLSYTIDVYRGRAKAQKNVVTFGAYVMLFPQLIAGPIVRYTEVEEQLSSRTRSLEDYAIGVRRFVCGLSKKVLLANAAGAVCETITADANRTVTLAWLGAFFYAFQIYFDFAGYSDMAIGLGKMFGFTFPENFDHPYEAESATDFWRRWHMTLSGWFREYVYIPLGGNRRGKLRTVFNLLLVWALTGFWHGASWNFLLWGLYWFVLLTLEKCGVEALLKRLPGAFRHMYALLVILLGWILFANEKLPAAGDYYTSLVRGTVWNPQTGYLLRTNLILFVLMALFCTGLPVRLFNRLSRHGKEIDTSDSAADGTLSAGAESVWPAVIRTAVMAVVFLLSVACLIRESYNPFLYFRF